MNLINGLTQNTNQIPSLEFMLHIYIFGYFLIPNLCLSVWFMISRFRIFSSLCENSENMFPASVQFISIVSFQFQFQLLALLLLQMELGWSWNRDWGRGWSCQDLVKIWNVEINFGNKFFSCLLCRLGSWQSTCPLLLR